MHYKKQTEIKIYNTIQGVMTEVDMIQGMHVKYYRNRKDKQF